VRAELSKLPAAELAAELGRVDPVAAAKRSRCVVHDLLLRRSRRATGDEHRRSEGN